MYNNKCAKPQSAGFFNIMQDYSGACGILQESAEIGALTFGIPYCCLMVVGTNQQESAAVPGRRSRGGAPGAALLGRRSRGGAPAVTEGPFCDPAAFS